MDANENLLRQVEIDYPYLMTREKWGKKISGVALATKNIKRLLKNAFPGVEFSVKSDVGSMMCCAYIYWEDPQEDGLYRKISAMTALFQSTIFNGMDDSTTYDRTPYHVAFRKQFGSVSSVVPQPRPLSPERVAQIEAKKLQSETKPSPGVRRSRRL